MTWTAWKFKTRNFTVKLHIDEDYNYQYDGDDEDGEIQCKLDAGEYVAFDSTVSVYYKGCEIGSDSLGASVYDAHDMSEFWQSHFKSPPESRNTIAMKAKHRIICRYFPSMVREAIASARKHVSNIPHLRKV